MSVLNNKERSFHIPADAEQLLLLAERIINNHMNAGVNSPLNFSQIADLNYRVRNARAKHEEGEKYNKLMRDAFRERDILLGLNDSQYGNFTNSLTVLAEKLSEVFEERQEELKKWGL